MAFVSTGATYVTTGAVGACATFASAAATNFISYLNPVQHLNGSVNAVTVAFWVKPSSTSGLSTPFSIGNAAQTK